MKALHTYIFIISLCCASGILHAQEDQPENEPEETKAISARDTLPPSEKYGIRVGIDLARILRTGIDDNYQGLELLGDYRISKKIFVAAELGNESLLRDEENISVEGSGSYIRVGADYNSYDNWYGMQNLIYVGLRYGYSIFDQNLERYRIFTPSPYFPSEERTTPIEETGLSAGWIEFIVGLKVELFHNIFLSGSVSIKNIVHEQKPDRFDNLFIPGFGRTNDFSNIGVGYNYTLSYLIPFKKKKR